MRRQIADVRGNNQNAFGESCRSEWCYGLAVCSATLLTVGRRAATVHTPSTDIQFFAVAVIEAALEVIVVRDIVNCVGVVFGPPTAMTAGQKSHDCQ